MDKYLKKMKKCFFIKNIENEAKEISLPFGTANNYECLQENKGSIILSNTYKNNNEMEVQ